MLIDRGIWVLWGNKYKSQLGCSMTIGEKIKQKQIYQRSRLWRSWLGEVGNKKPTRIDYSDHRTSRKHHQPNKTRNSSRIPLLSLPKTHYFGLTPQKSQSFHLNSLRLLNKLWRKRGFRHFHQVMEGNSQVLQLLPVLQPQMHSLQTSDFPI